MTDDQRKRKFLVLIAEAEGGIPASSFPRAKRGETLKALELEGFIHYGPGGWYLTESGRNAIA